METSDIIINDAELSRIMYERGMRPSLMRLAVLTLIANTRRHPTADEIYNELSSIYPSISRTTVYNSLHSLADCGIIRDVEVESGVLHYDFALQPRHSHFRCRVCGKIFDMEMPADIAPVDSHGFEIEDVDVVFKGQCPECRNKYNLK